jgi:hypothetical protein
MSCGLGAVILVLMLVKQDVQSAHIEADLLREDMARLQAEETRLATELADVGERSAAEARRIEAASQALALTGQALEQASRAVAERQAELRELQQSIERTEIPRKPDVIETPRVGEESYVIGLSVTGSRIALLVDASASMTDEILIDIIRRKNAADAERQAGPKWQRTRRIVDWLLARAPAASQVSVITFAGSATPLGGSDWHAAGDGAAMRRVLDALDRVVPHGATNLHAALETAARLSPTDIYLVTDGLPTAGRGGYRSLNPFSGCSALWGGASTISGECRARLFLHTVNSASLRGATINVVLLPVEGDPEASSLYWRWTAANNGVTISPAASWP